MIGCGYIYVSNFNHDMDNLMEYWNIHHQDLSWKLRVYDNKNLCIENSRNQFNK